MKTEDLDPLFELVSDVTAELESAPSVTDGEIEIYSTGLVACSVCAPAGMDREIVERQVNAMAPTGISSRWTIADEPFVTGEPNPSPCNDDPGRLHYLLTC